ncbi:winged helix-turn-helix transcriptional regulator [uncultured Maribacter sp.]|uniref:winged helix-turn-helix transcriptional regulator n=1 Tax=uncultured Maribacter sp. TaxID=431308 RepID=UPI00262F6039|nr:winged helix-turn-helix transcriptional regulator [uncultured Maribacter sp.]
MTFSVKEVADESTIRDDDKESGVTGGAMGGVTGGAIDAIDALTKRQKEVLKLIATNTTITYTEIAEALGINESPVGKHINALKK